MFDVGRRYRRRDLHQQYGGQGQGGISTPSRFPIILLFTGESGELYGYRDHWDADGTFRYTGEGQIGDMEFVRGNRSIRDHAGDGKDLHLFEIEPDDRRYVRYRGQMVCASYDLVPNVPDRAENDRTAIIFHLVPIGGAPAAGGPVAEESSADSDGAEAPTSSYWTRPLEEVRAIAVERPPADLEPRLARATSTVAARRSRSACNGARVACVRDAGGSRPSRRPTADRTWNPTIPDACRTADRTIRGG
jgi:5-methylcytosine-specific restriction enzyme A